MKTKFYSILICALSFGFFQDVHAAIVTVTNNNDTGAGSLRDAIQNAAPNDTIDFSTSGTISIITVINWNKNLTILGPGIANLTLDGGNSTNLFRIDGGVNLIRDLAFINGSSSDGGCILSPPGATTDTTFIENCTFKNSTVTGGGGGVHTSNNRYLVMRNCWIDNCQSTNNVGGGLEAFYGAIIENTTFSNCFSAGTAGGAYIVNNVSTITNCTFYNNSCAQRGGAIGFFGQTTVLLMNNTFARNSAGISGDAVNAQEDFPFGGPQITYQNNIFESPVTNYSETNIAGGVVNTSNGGNITNDTSMAFFLTGPGDLSDTTTLLDPADMQNNGGPTPTIALQCTSPAVDGGISAGAPLLDQRGIARTAIPDAGAYEYIPLTSSQTLTICPGDSVTVGTNTYDTTGIYTDVLSAANGCDSTVTTDLTVFAIDTAVSSSGGSLIANSATGKTFQWIDCGNGNQPIVGDTNQVFTPAVVGSYAVVETQNGCSDTSACYSITTVRVNENESGKGIKISPNPATNNVVVTFERNFQNPTVRLLDQFGQVVFETRNVSNNRISIDLSRYGAGLYFVEITEKNNTNRYKVVKN